MSIQQMEQTQKKDIYLQFKQMCKPWLLNFTNLKLKFKFCWLEGNQDELTK